MTEAAEVVAEPATRVVVTPDNAQAFYDEKLGVSREEPQEAVAEEVKADAKPAEDEDDDDADVKKAKKNPKIAAQFHKITEKRRAAEAKASEAQEQARIAQQEREAVQRERDELKAKYEPPKTDPLGPKPGRAQFDSDGDYEKAIEDWTSDKVRHDQQTEAQQKAEKDRQDKLSKEWRDRTTAARKEIDDYDEKINSSTVAVSDPVRDAIHESEVGPQILYHLATNEDFADKLAKMSPSSALREIGRLEAKLIDKKEEPKTTIAEISKAPPPITPLKTGSGGGNTPLLDSKGVFHGTYDQWKEARKAGRIK